MEEILNTRIEQKLSKRETNSEEFKRDEFINFRPLQPSSSPRFYMV